MQQHKHGRVSLISGIMFLLLTIIHATRIVMEWEVSVQSFHIPIWPSVIALVICATMSVWNFREWRCLNCSESKN